MLEADGGLVSGTPQNLEYSCTGKSWICRGVSYLRHEQVDGNQSLWSWLYFRKHFSFLVLGSASPPPAPAPVYRSFGEGTFYLLVTFKCVSYK
jgi:hypothetical protein